MSSKPRVGMTMGDPAGVGPELCLRALSAPGVAARCVPVVFGHAGILNRVAHLTSLPAPACVLSADDWQGGIRPDAPTVIDLGRCPAAAIEPGMISAAGGREAALFIRAAARAALEGAIVAVVTAPIHKQAMRLAGVTHPGHTEFLAELTGAREMCMMFAAQEMIISLVTIHVAYRDVVSLLTPARIRSTVCLTVEALERLGMPHPRLTVCGLNPHAGEAGAFGNEERDVITPAIEQCRAEGIDIRGPLPPDTAFIPRQRALTDAYIAMYHDQALIPFKMLTFEKGTNITLGLPIIRTSVDHGTAYDIAWKGEASPGSLFTAIDWALRLSGE